MSTMPSINNKVIVACAGSGKTTYIVDEALKLRNKRILITTYTVENLDQIETYFIEKMDVSLRMFLFRHGLVSYFRMARGHIKII